VIGNVKQQRRLIYLIVLYLSRLHRSKVKKTKGPFMLIPTIAKIEAIPFTLSFDTSLRSGRGFFPKAENVLVRVTTDTGVVGFAEAMGFKQLFGESQQSIVWAIEQWIAPKIMGLPISAIEKVWAELDLIQGNNTAKGSVDIALHDALAKHIGLPLYQMLGGWIDRIGLTWIVGLASIEQMLEDAMTASAKGFKSFKIKIGDSTEKDVEVIRLIREALGNDVLLYVDANQAYTPTEAMRALPRMMEYGIEIVEDPIPHWHTESRLKLARMLPVPLLGDESVVSPMDIKREIDTGALGMINIKTARSGFYQSRKIIHLAEQAGYRCLIGTLLETDIGALASAHFGAAFRAFTYPAELTYHLKMQDHLLDSPLNIQDGSLILPTAPGLGIELDEEKLERYRVKSFGSH